MRYVDAFAQAIDLQADDVLVGWVPFHHDLGLVGYLLFPLLTGVHLVSMAPDFWVRRPHILLRAIQQYGGTLTILPHFALAHLLHTIRERDLAGLDLSTLRRLLVGAEIIQQSTIQAFQARFLPYSLRPEVLGVVFGMAESVLISIMTPYGQNITSDSISKRTLLAERWAKPLPATDPDAVAIVDCGVPMSGISVAIVDDEDNHLPDRHIGEIVLCSPFLFDSYHQRPDLTAVTLRAGQLYTGDLGYLVEGHVFVVDRKHDVIIAAGKNIYPESIERLGLAELGEVAGRVAAFGVRDERLGTEQLVLVCEVRGRVDHDSQRRYSQQLRWRVQQELDVALADVRLVRRGWLAITTSGKVARSASREKYLAAGFAPQPLDLLPPDLLHRTSAEMEAALGLFFGDVLGGALVAATTNLFEAGVSSLQLAQLISKIQQTYACTLPIEQFVQQPTIAQLTKFLHTAHAAPETKVMFSNLTLRRPLYSKNRWLNYLLNNGFLLHQLALPYAFGVRLQRTWLAQRWVQERFFREPLTLVKYRASQVGEPAPQEAILRSLMCNIWAFWRIHHLGQPATFARWCTVQSADSNWPPKQPDRGVIYALTHTPDSCYFHQALQHHGITPIVIAWRRIAGLAPQQVQTMQVYEAQQTLRQGGVAVIFADGTFGSGGITVDFWGGRRNFRPGMAALAAATGAAVLPVFSSFATTGAVTFEIAAPLVAQGNTPDERIESRLVDYANVLRNRWSQLYSNLWWHFLR